MRADMGWWIWFWRIGPLTFGVDFATWGLGFLVGVRAPRGIAIHAGPFYLTMESADLGGWLKNQLDSLADWMEIRFRNFCEWLDVKLTEWEQRRYAKRIAKLRKKGGGG